MIHHFQIIPIRVLQCFPDRGQPFIQATLSLYPFVAPMGSQSTFGHSIHTFGTYLDLYPCIFRTKYRDVKTFVSIAFRNTEPVTQTFGVRLVHIGNNTINLPTLHLFPFRKRVKNNTDGKKIIDSLEVGLLFLHLLVDGVYTLGTSLDMKMQSGFVQFLFDRAYECCDITVTGLLGGIEFLLDMVVHLLLGIFEGQVLQFRFQFI